MSRRDRSSKQRRAHRERLRERRVQQRQSMPRAPARHNFFGFGRRGDDAKLCLDFTGPTIDLDPQELATGDPAEALRSALLRQAWVETGFETQAEG